MVVVIVVVVVEVVRNDIQAEFPNIYWMCRKGSVKSKTLISVITSLSGIQKSRWWRSDIMNALIDTFFFWHPAQMISHLSVIKNKSIFLFFIWKCWGIQHTLNYWRIAVFFTYSLWYLSRTKSNINFIKISQIITLVFIVFKYLGSIFSLTLFFVKINSITQYLKPGVDCSLHVDDFQISSDITHCLRMPSLHWAVSRSSQCSTAGVTKAVVCAILSVGWCI